MTKNPITQKLKEVYYELNKTDSAYKKNINNNTIKQENDYFNEIFRTVNKKNKKLKSVSDRLNSSKGKFYNNSKFHTIEKLLKNDLFNSDTTKINNFDENDL